MVKHHGSLLWENESGSKAVYLYQVDGFYVEICCDHAKKEILWIKPFDSPDQLEPYISTIDISEVL